MPSTNAYRAVPARSRTGSLVLAALFLLLPLRALGSPDSDDIVVVAVEGEVEVTMDGAARAAMPGTALSLPAVVSTGRDGSIDLRQGETTIGVGPDTRLEFPAPAQSTAAPERVVQPRGNAFYDVGPQAGRRFRVETPFLVAVIKGTQFNVAADADSATVSLFEGRLEILATDGDAVVMLNAGEVATRRRGEDAIRVLRLDDEKAAFAVPGAAGSGESANDLIPTDPDAPGLDEPPDGSPLDDDVDDVFTPADTGATTGALDDDIGIDVGDGLGSLADTDAAVELDAGVGAIEAGVSADLDLGDDGIAADVGADVDFGGASADLGADAGLDLDTGTVDAGLDAGVDLGAGGADLGADVGADLDAGTVDADLDADADLGAGSVDVGADAGVDLDAGSVDAGVDADVLGSDASVDLGIDLSGDDAGLDVGIDLGLGGESEEDGEGEDSGGLLDGLLRGRDSD